MSLDKCCKCGLKFDKPIVSKDGGKYLFSDGTYKQIMIIRNNKEYVCCSSCDEYWNEKYYPIYQNTRGIVWGDLFFDKFLKDKPFIFR